MGRTTKVISKDAADTELANVSYAYDGLDNMTEIVRGDGMKYVLAYNNFHNLESIGIEGKDEKLVAYTYKSGNGRLKEMTYANGDRMKASYNSAGQLVAERWYDASENLTAHYKYVYDGQGNVVRSIDVLSLKEYNYSYEDGRITRSTECDITLNESGLVIKKNLVNSIIYYYDQEGGLTRKRIIPAEGSEQVIYYENPENENAVVKFTAGGKTVTSHSKNDSFGRKVFDELQLGTGFVSRQFDYHAGEVTEEHLESDKLKSTPTTQLVKRITLSDGRTLDYEYDGEERITKVVDSYKVAGSEAETVEAEATAETDEAAAESTSEASSETQTVTTVTEYTYDSLGQLLTETVNGTVINSMTYDNYGNILTKNSVAYTYGDSIWKDKLTGYGDQSITYDAQGNPTSYLGHTLSWEKGRQLKQLTKSDGTAVSYTYDVNGIRTSKTVNGTTHTYTLDGTKILKEVWGSNTLIPLYDNEDSVCGIILNDEPYYFYKNQQGDIIEIADKDSKTIARYTYDAWGKVLGVTNAEGNAISDPTHIANINPYRYRGYYYDVDTELYYLQSRYYNPVVGRFVNGDEEECALASQNVLDANLFSYCESEPVNNTDSNGAISYKKVLKILKGLFKYAKKIMGWAVDYFDNQISLYSSLSWEDVSAIAKEIKRSPHRVRQSIERLKEQLPRSKKPYAVVAKGLAIIYVMVTASYYLKNNMQVIELITEGVVEGLTELIKLLVGKLSKKIVKLIPAIGALLGFWVCKAISVALDAIFSNKFLTKVKKKYKKSVNVKTYKLADYFILYFKSWS